MYQATVNITACNDLNHVDHSLQQNIKVGDANSVPPDTTPPSLGAEPVARCRAGRKPAVRGRDRSRKQRHHTQDQPRGP
jgi:hypothetical protein